MTYFCPFKLLSISVSFADDVKYLKKISPCSAWLIGPFNILPVTPSTALLKLIIQKKGFPPLKYI